MQLRRTGVINATLTRIQVTASYGVTQSPALLLDSMHAGRCISRAGYVVARARNSPMGRVGAVAGNPGAEAAPTEMHG